MADNTTAESSAKKAKTSDRRYCPAPSSEKELEKFLYESDEESFDHDDGDSDDYGSSDDDFKHYAKQFVFASYSDSEDDGNFEQPPVVTPAQQWSKNSVMKKICFTKQMELLVQPNGTRPIDFFNMLVDESFFDLIVRETNRQAEEIFLSSVTAPSSRISRWREITVEELRVFFGVFLHMGTISLNRLQDYWKTSSLFSIPFFTSSMSRDRFLLILRCLHFVPNSVEGHPYPEDRLYKIRPLINYFNNKMCEIYCPGQNLTLNESMMLWRGRLMLEKKMRKYGIKLYALTEADGTILKFAVNTGQLDDCREKNHVTNVALHLLEERLDLGHSIYMDNFYSSHDLAVQLLNRHTYATGTLIQNKKTNPVDIINKKLKKGETISRYSDDGVLVGKWKDVVYISTEFPNEMVTYYDKYNRAREKPNPIFQYNKYMAGVNKKHQLLSYYPCERICFRWYKKLGLHIVQMLLINSYLLFKKYVDSKMSLYDFRLNVIASLVPEKAPAPICPLSIFHNPRKNPMGASGKIVSRRCVWCYNRSKKRRETTYHCPACANKPYLCVGECFAGYHNQM